MPRMRTIAQAVQAIKADDPESKLSEWWLRQLVKSGKLKCHRAGNKYLVDLDALMRFLENPPNAEEVTRPYGVLRRINP
ncbi:MAG: hypothetical protein ACYCV0_14115 [Desulfitobacteriaceae bacterium]